MKLMNSAMMPQMGWYYCKQIDHQEFAFILERSYKSGSLENFIGYQQNIDLIANWTGIVLTPSRSETRFKDKDSALVMKLKYRVHAPNTKGQIVGVNDFEFYLVRYYKYMDSRMLVTAGNP